MPVTVDEEAEPHVLPAARSWAAPGYLHIATGRSPPLPFGLRSPGRTTDKQQPSHSQFLRLADYQLDKKLSKHCSGSSKQLAPCYGLLPSQHTSAISGKAHKYHSQHRAFTFLYLKQKAGLLVQLPILFFPLYREKNQNYQDQLLLHSHERKSHGSTQPTCK